MQRLAILLVVALAASACGDDGAPTGTATTTIPTVVTGASNEITTGSEVFVPWHERATFAPLDQDPSDCFNRDDDDTDDSRDPGDDVFFIDELEADIEPFDDIEPPEVLQSAHSWLVLTTAPVVDDDGATAVVEVDPAALTLHPAADFVPTHVATRDDDIQRSLGWLADREDIDLLAILFVALDGFDISPIAGETHAEIAAGWAIIDGEFISLAGCHTVTYFAGRFGDFDLDRRSEEADFTAALEEITTSRDSLFEAMGVGGDGFRFSACPAEDDPGLIPSSRLRRGADGVRLG